MVKLSVNINKIATLRNARGGTIPNVVQVALDCERFGADGITVHPRPDERHIRKQDVFDLAPKLSTEFNIEGYPSTDFIELVCSIKPAQVTLVPDPPHVLTSNAGWNTIEQEKFLIPRIEKLKAAGCRVSIFLDPDPEMVSAALNSGADRIELYTEAYASEAAMGKAEEAIVPYRNTAEIATKAGLGINAGHDLNLHNLHYFCTQIPGLLEVSIGHALVADALYYGLENVIGMYKLRCVPGIPVSPFS
jgi:pyridoxine 5-phosphate synthase